MSGTAFPIEAGKYTTETASAEINRNSFEQRTVTETKYEEIVSSQAREAAQINPAELTNRNQENLGNLSKEVSTTGQEVPSFFGLTWDDVESTTDPETGEKTYEVKSGKYDENGNRNPEHTLLNQHPLPANATIIVHEPDGTTTIYKTDSLGRVISMEKKDLNIVPKDDRQRDSNQTKETKNVKDGKPDDQGGHLLGDQFGGCSEQINLVPMSQEVNQSVFSKIENALKKALEEGKSVTDYKVEPIYEGDSARPVGFKVSYKIDGKPYTVIIPSN